ncbi:hypothetical protein RF11_02801 [Thelohanellus kitauei]|uniref:Uncharacterized protein n=1 Tax=Thelohanellus kitauei TaxID=669202 RepID=A0A0C2MRL6_THEKT|nr:hypothetical protein RF11_02801 [Thelohanellus kitauei]
MSRSFFVPYNEMRCSFENITLVYFSTINLMDGCKLDLFLRKIKLEYLESPFYSCKDSVSTPSTTTTTTTKTHDHNNKIIIAVSTLLVICVIVLVAGVIFYCVKYRRN